MFFQNDEGSPVFHGKTLLGIVISSPIGQSIPSIGQVINYDYYKIFIKEITEETSPGESSNPSIQN